MEYQDTEPLPPLTTPLPQLLPQAPWSSTLEITEDQEMDHPAPPVEKTLETFQERKSAASLLYGA
jgi:hypothetical protein